MANGTCVIEGCERGRRAREMCMMHYQRWRKGKDMATPPRILGDDEARFWSKVDKAGPTPVHRPELGPCWLWVGSTKPRGYGGLMLKSGLVPAHRFAYGLLIGPIPAGLTIDHICHNGSGCPGGSTCPHRRCVNPTHLEAVSGRREQTAGDGAGSHQRPQDPLRQRSRVHAGEHDGLPRPQKLSHLSPGDLRDSAKRDAINA